MNDLLVADAVDYHRGQLLREAAIERLARQARSARSATPAAAPVRIQLAARLRALAQWVAPAPQTVTCCSEPACA